MTTLCLTLITACGDRSSKKRRTTPVHSNFAGTQHNQGSGPATDNSQGLNKDNHDFTPERTGNSRDIIDNEDQRATTTPTREQLHTEGRQHEGEHRHGNDHDDSTEGTSRARDSRLGQHDGGFTTTRPRSRNSENHRTGDQTHHDSESSTPVPPSRTEILTDPLSGLEFYENNPYDKNIRVESHQLTGYSVEDNGKTLFFTDLVNDSVLSRFQQMYSKDTHDSVDTFAQDSEALAQSINHVYANIDLESKKLFVTIHKDRDENDDSKSKHVLHFSGQLNGRTAQLAPTQKSDLYNYVLDVTCLDSQADSCDNLQTVLSLYYKTGEKKGQLCQRAYIVNRLAHATFNVDSSFLNKYTRQQDDGSDPLRFACYQSNSNHASHAVACFADFIYNTVTVARFNKCSDKRTTTEVRNCQAPLKTQLANNPEYASTINLHTYTVLNGKSEFLLSIEDKHGKYLSFNGMLLDSQNEGENNTSIRVNKSTYRKDGISMPATRLYTHISSAYLNGVDAKGVMQLKLNYESTQETVFSDIVNRFNSVDESNLRTEFSIPTDEEIVVQSEDSEVVQSESRGSFSRVKNIFKNMFRSSLPTYISDNYRCDDLNKELQKHKRIHLQSKKWGSRDVYYNKNQCLGKSITGGEQKPEPAKFPTEDQDYCVIGYYCEEISSN